MVAFGFAPLSIWILYLAATSLATSSKTVSCFPDAIHIDGHSHKGLDAPRVRVPARRSLFEKRARHPFVSCFARDLTGTCLTASTIFAMGTPRAAIFALTIRPVQAFRYLKFEKKQRALLETKRVTSKRPVAGQTTWG